MTQQDEQSRTSPMSTGGSIAYQVMNEAAAFYLQNGGVAAAREHVDRLANELKFYPDNTEAYRTVMAQLSEAERQERHMAAGQRQQEQRNVMMAMMSAMQPQQQQPPQPEATASSEPPTSSPLPAELATPRAMRLWELAQAAGYVDEDYQPLLSRTQSALLADWLSVLTGIQNKWKTFEELWNRRNMRSDYNLALTQRQSLDFQDELKKTLPVGTHA
jgi:hypothetical protein